MKILIEAAMLMPPIFAAEINSASTISVLDEFSLVHSQFSRRYMHIRSFPLHVQLVRPKWISQIDLANDGPLTLNDK